MRGAAAVAQMLYRETAESQAARVRNAVERKEMLAQGLMTENKPSTRDRRELARLRGRIHRF